MRLKKGHGIMDSIPFDNISLENICGSDNNHPVIYWLARKIDIKRLTKISEKISENKTTNILEIGCGTGFLSYLLAQTGKVKVIATDKDPKHIDDPEYKHPNLSYDIVDAKDITRSDYKDIDIVLNSFMDYGTNLTPNIIELDPKAIFFVRTYFSTGTSGSYITGNDYKQEFRWPVLSHQDVSEIRNYYLNDRLCLENFKRNPGIIEIHLKRDINPFSIKDIEVKNEEKYPWEIYVDDIVKNMEEMK